MEKDINSIYYGFINDTAKEYDLNISRFKMVLDDLIDEITPDLKKIGRNPASIMAQAIVDMTNWLENAERNKDFLAIDFSDPEYIAAHRKAALYCQAAALRKK